MALLYLTYGALAGLGIGIAYNVVIATVSSWFPDKKGLCSGALMMGFGASALVLGNIADSLFKSDLGWRTTYVILGAAIGTVLVLTSLLLNKPGGNAILPQPKAGKTDASAGLDKRDLPPVKCCDVLLSGWRLYVYHFLLLWAAL